MTSVDVVVLDGLQLISSSPPLLVRQLLLEILVLLLQLLSMLLFLLVLLEELLVLLPVLHQVDVVVAGLLDQALGSEALNDLLGGLMILLPFT